MYGLASSPAPRPSLARLFERMESLLPCAGPCGIPGPHRTYPARGGAVIALCGDCRRLVEAETAQDRRENLTNRSKLAHV